MNENVFLCLDFSFLEYFCKCILFSILVFLVFCDIFKIISFVSYEGVWCIGEIVCGGLDV